MNFSFPKLGWTILFLASLVLTFQVSEAEAAFGISPPFLNADHLLKGSTYVQTIFLVQDKPDQAIRIKTELDINDRVKSWIKINGGKEIVIPKGVRQFPVSVEVTIPKDAELGLYKGNVSFIGIPDQEGQVTIALGVTLIMNLTVGEGIYRNYNVPLIQFLDIEEGWSPRVLVKFYNGGNVYESFDAATYELFDHFGSLRLAFVQKNDGFEEVPPFTTRDMKVEFPIDLHLGLGQYWGAVSFSKEGKVLASQRSVFNVLEKGSLSNPFKVIFDHLMANKIYYGIGILVILLAWVFYRKKGFKLGKG